MSYRNLLLRQQALLEKDPETQKKLVSQAEEVRQHAVDLLKARRAPLRVGGDVTAPVLIKRVEAIYPEEAKRHALPKGVVIVEAVVDKTGHVGNITVLKPLPYGGSEAAIAALKQWIYKPAMRNGEPVDVLYNMTVTVAP